jgi:hypothetical protein
MVLALVDRPKVTKSWRSIIGSRIGWRDRHWQTVSSVQAAKQCPPKTLADTVIFFFLADSAIDAETKCNITPQCKRQGTRLLIYVTVQI